MLLITDLLLEVSNKGSVWLTGLQFFVLLIDQVEPSGPGSQKHVRDRGAAGQGRSDQNLMQEGQEPELNLSPSSACTEHPHQ